MITEAVAGAFALGVSVYAFLPPAGGIHAHP